MAEHHPQDDLCFRRVPAYRPMEQRRCGEANTYPGRDATLYWPLREFMDIIILTFIQYDIQRFIGTIQFWRDSPGVQNFVATECAGTGRTAWHGGLAKNLSFDTGNKTGAFPYYIRLGYRWESCVPMIDMNCAVYAKEDNALMMHIRSGPLPKSLSVPWCSEMDIVRTVSVPNLKYWVCIWNH